MTTFENIKHIQGRLRHNAEKWESRTPLTPGHRGALNGHITSLTNSDAMRRLILYVWFRQEEDEIEGMSSNDLTSGEWQALKELVDAHEMEKEWFASARFHRAVNQTKAYINFRLS